MRQERRIVRELRYLIAVGQNDAKEAILEGTRRRLT
jgi:hypothetical protein